MILYCRSSSSSSSSSSILYLYYTAVGLPDAWVGSSQHCLRPRLQVILSFGPWLVRLHSLMSLFTHSRKVLWGLLWTLAPGSAILVTVLIHETERCTWPIILICMPWVLMRSHKGQASWGNLMLGFPTEVWPQKASKFCVVTASQLL